MSTRLDSSPLETLLEVGKFELSFFKFERSVKLVDWGIVSLTRQVLVDAGKLSISHLLDDPFSD